MQSDKVDVFLAHEDYQVRIFVSFVPGGNVSPIEDGVLRACADALEKLWDKKVEMSNHHLGVRGR